MGLLVGKHGPILNGLIIKFDVLYKYHDVVLHHDMGLKENFEDFLEYGLGQMLRVSTEFLRRSNVDITKTSNKNPNHMINSEMYLFLICTIQTFKNHISYIEWSVSYLSSFIILPCLNLFHATRESMFLNIFEDAPKIFFPFLWYFEWDISVFFLFFIHNY